MVQAVISRSIACDHRFNRNILVRYDCEICCQLNLRLASGI